MDWREIVEAGERQFERCCELDRAEFGNTPEKSEALREWWEITKYSLLVFTRTYMQRGELLDPFPWEMLSRLANISEELSNGIVPRFVADTAIKGKGRPLFRGERRALAYAIYYIEAADGGAIDDPHPRKTVRIIYNVSSQTVRNWMTKRESYCANVPGRDWPPDRLQERMRREGENYRVNGRGAPTP